MEEDNRTETPVQNERTGKPAKKRKNRKKRIIVWSVSLSVILLCTIYIMVICLPYAGSLSVSEFYQQQFSSDRFFSDTQCSERVMMLDDGQQAFFHRINVLNQAASGSEICISSYATQDGYASDVFFGAVLAAANRGARVRIVLDSKYAGLSANTRLALLSAPGVTLYLFNPLQLHKPHTINVCLHDKYLTVDNRYMIFGGRNIGNKYFDIGPAGSYRPSSDREVLVYNTQPLQNGSIQEVIAYFDTVVSAGPSRQQPVPKGKKRDKGLRHAAALEQIYRTYMLTAPDGPAYLAITAAANRISLLTNPVEGGKKQPLLAYQLYRLALESNELIIQSPYLMLTKQSLERFHEVTAAASVTILTNSLASTPNPFYSNYYVNRSSYQRNGAKLYEFQDENRSIHAKTVILDRRLTAIGSFNLDERSIRIDTESMLLIDSLEFNAIARSTLDTYFAKSLRVQEDGTYQSSDTVQAGRVSGWKKFGYSVLGFLLNAVKYLL